MKFHRRQYAIGWGSLRKGPVSDQQPSVLKPFSWSIAKVAPPHLRFSSEVASAVASSVSFSVASVELWLTESMPADKKRCPSGSTSHHWSPIFVVWKNPVAFSDRSIQPPYLSSLTSAWGVKFRRSVNARLGCAIHFPFSNTVAFSPARQHLNIPITKQPATASRARKCVMGRKRQVPAGVFKSHLSSID